MSDFNTSIVGVVQHRPWPMPTRPWVMTQTWHDLLFAHWAVDARELAGRVPPPFVLDLFDGAAWIGVVPFHMTNVSARGMPALPGVSAFPELNVRTYVHVGDRPGVYFFSLDAASRLAVRAARVLFNLPYWFASMSVTRQHSRIHYRSRRSGYGARAEFDATYGPDGDVHPPEPGSLEYFLTERYCLYQIDWRGRPYRLDIHHPPWPLQAASAEIRVNSMASAADLRLPETPPILHFSRRQDMVGWMPVGLEGRGA